MNQNRPHNDPRSSPRKPGEINSLSACGEGWGGVGTRDEISSARCPGIRPSSFVLRPYPVALNLEGARCVIVGGGSVALRKARGLLAAGALVTVIAPDASDEMKNLAVSDGRMEWFSRSFEPDDVRGARLVFACSDSAEVNAQVAAAGREAGALVNRADDPLDCDFMGMSVVTRGSLTIAVSTGSDSPAFARWMRGELERQFGPEYGEFLTMLASLRSEVLEQIPAEDRSRMWDAALRSDAFALWQAGKRDEAVQTLRTILLGPG
ncbi:MAG TPA: bifunctional precorrin-2 dehydrogenase/sirohydrochlorin ferrochelatase [Armatimonadota bacterium]|nr:bifunctional precorrin-2 dehydrogenase/sirohydrochlorin ferrochelatase [Armatimonadota bacterium]